MFGTLRSRVRLSREFPVSVTILCGFLDLYHKGEIKWHSLVTSMLSGKAGYIISYVIVSEAGQNREQYEYLVTNPTRKDRGLSWMRSIGWFETGHT